MEASLLASDLLFAPFVRSFPRVFSYFHERSYETTTTSSDAISFGPSWNGSVTQLNDLDFASTPSERLYEKSGPLRFKEISNRISKLASR